MRLFEAAKPMFARHETFHPRYGWFRKAYTCAAQNPRVFLQDDATVQIGVGKNMVRAIRFWGLAAKLIEEDARSSNRRSPDIIPTRFGHALFGHRGWDEYMEDPGTLWLLHWLLLAPPSRLPAWWLAFNEFHAIEFSYDELEAAISVLLEAVPEWADPHPSSVKKDVSALLRTYAPAEQSKRRRIDDILDCPFRELNLIGRSVAANRYRFTLGAKPTLPSEMVAYAALDYIARTNVRGNTVTLGRLTHELGAPGNAFKLTEGEFQAALEPTIAKTDALRLTSITGAVQLSWSKEPMEIANQILKRYYGISSPGARVDASGSQPFTATSVGIQ